MNTMGLQTLFSTWLGIALIAVVSIPILFTILGFVIHVGMGGHDPTPEGKREEIWYFFNLGRLGSTLLGIVFVVAWFYNWAISRFTGSRDTITDDTLTWLLAMIFSLISVFGFVFRTLPIGSKNDEISKK